MDGFSKNFTECLRISPVCRNFSTGNRSSVFLPEILYRSGRPAIKTETLILLMNAECIFSYKCKQPQV